MRKYASALTLLFLSAMAVMTSCNKESNSGGDPVPVDTSTTKLILSNMFAGTRTMTPMQTLEVNAGMLQVVRGAGNTKLTFYPNSFKDRNGNIITTGQIDIKLIEMYRPGQVMANRSSATSNGRLLISGGQVYIKAYRAGEEVFPTVYGIGFNGASGATQPMNLFYGNNNNADSIVTWTESVVNAGTRSGGTVTDTTIQPAQFYYQFDSCTNFNWINCDYFQNYAGQQLTNLFMVMKDTVGLDNTNTQVFLVFPAINSVTYFQLYNKTLKTYSFSPNYKVPVNMSFHAISISLLKGKYYYSEQLNLTTAPDMIDTMRPNLKPLPDILTSLSAL